MKKIITLAALLSISLLLAAELPTIAVLEFKNINITPEKTQAVRNRFTQLLSKPAKGYGYKGKISVLDNLTVKKTLENKSLSSSGCDKLECALELGKALGVDFVIHGHIQTRGKWILFRYNLIDVYKGENVNRKGGDWSGDAFSSYEEMYNKHFEHYFWKLEEAVKVRFKANKKAQKNAAKGK